MTEINDIDVEKAIKLYLSVKKKHDKYVHSEKGIEAVRRASAKYKQKMSSDPEYLAKRRARNRERYHQKKLINIDLLPSIEN